MPFKVGHEFYKSSTKQKRSKNLLPIIRDRVLQCLEKRLSHKNIVDDIPTEDLLRFAQSIMPKDLSVRVIPDIQYISSTPRPQSTLDNNETPKLIGEGETTQANDTRPLNTIEHEILNEVGDSINGDSDAD